MKKIVILFLAAFSFLAMAKKEGMLTYHLDCGEYYAKCKQENLEQEISCMRHSIDTQSGINVVCKSEVKRAHEIMDKIFDSCEADWKKNCKGEIPFSPEGNQCFKKNKFNSECSKLIRDHLGNRI